MLATLFRCLLHVFFCLRHKRRLVVLTYHRIHAEHDPLEPDSIDRKQFERHISALARCFNVLPLREAVQRLQNRELPTGAVCITFDDGYANNVDVALPILEKYRTPATLFIASGFLNGGCMWNDIVIESVRRTALSSLNLSSIGLQEYAVGTNEEKLEAIDRIIGELKYRPMQARRQDVRKVAELADVTPPTDLMMNDEQVRRWHVAGMEVGGHTVNHPILMQIPGELAQQEIRDNKLALERIIDAKIRCFAYPNGRPGQDYNQQHINLTKNCGYHCAVTTAWGAAVPGCDPYQIPRISSWDKAGWKLVLRVLKTFIEKPGAIL